MASGSIEKTNPLFIQGKCYNGCEATLFVGLEKTQLYVCMEHLAGVSEFFRAMFFGDFKEKKEKEFKITDETPDDMICFFNSINPHPDVGKIADDSIECLMRLADKFQCDLLKARVKDHIEVNGPSPILQHFSIISNWFAWATQYNMSEEIVNIYVKKICYDTIEPLMHLADEYQSDLLKERLNNYMKLYKYCSEYTSATWFKWSLKYHMPEETIKLFFKIANDHSIGFYMRLADEYQSDILKGILKNYIEINGSKRRIDLLVLWLHWSQLYNMPEEIVNVCLKNVLKMEGYSMKSLMRGADEFQIDVLKDRLKQYIEVNEHRKPPLTIKNWLVWSLQHHMSEEIVKICLPGVACLSVSELDRFRGKIGLDLHDKLLNLKKELNKKATELSEKTNYLTSLTCCSYCKMENELPYRIQWCTTNAHLYVRCSNCLEIEYSHNCEMCEFYHKCSGCKLDPSPSKHKNQCRCARKNYEIMLREMV